MSDIGYLLGSNEALKAAVLALLEAHPNKDLVKSALGHVFGEVGAIVSSDTTAPTVIEGWTATVKYLQAGGMPVLGAVPPATTDET